MPLLGVGEAVGCWVVVVVVIVIGYCFSLSVVFLSLVPQEDEDAAALFAEHEKHNDIIIEQ